MKNGKLKFLELIIVFTVVFSQLLSPFIGSLHVIHALAPDVESSEVIQPQNDVVEQEETNVDEVEPVDIIEEETTEEEHQLVDVEEDSSTIINTPEEEVDLSSLGNDVELKSEVEISESALPRPGPRVTWPAGGPSSNQIRISFMNSQMDNRLAIDFTGYDSRQNNSGAHIWSNAYSKDTRTYGFDDYRVTGSTTDSPTGQNKLRINQTTPLPGLSPTPELVLSLNGTYTSPNRKITNVQIYRGGNPDNMITTNLDTYNVPPSGNNTIFPNGSTVYSVIGSYNYLPNNAVLAVVSSDGREISFIRHYETTNLSFRKYNRVSNTPMQNVGFRLFYIEEEVTSGFANNPPYRFVYYTTDSGPTQWITNNYNQGVTSTFGNIIKTDYDGRINFQSLSGNRTYFLEERSSNNYISPNFWRIVFNNGQMEWYYSNRNLNTRADFLNASNWIRLQNWNTSNRSYDPIASYPNSYPGFTITNTPLRFTKRDAFTREVLSGVGFKLFYLDSSSPYNRYYYTDNGGSIDWLNSNYGNGTEVFSQNDGVVSFFDVDATRTYYLIETTPLNYYYNSNSSRVIRISFDAQGNILWDVANVGINATRAQLINADWTTISMQPYSNNEFTLINYRDISIPLNTTKQWRDRFGNPLDSRYIPTNDVNIGFTYSIPVFLVYQNEGNYNSSITYSGSFHTGIGSNWVVGGSVGYSYYQYSLNRFIDFGDPTLSVTGNEPRHFILNQAYTTASSIYYNRYPVQINGQIRNDLVQDDLKINVIDGMLDWYYGGSFSQRETLYNTPFILYYFASNGDRYYYTIDASCNVVWVNANAVPPTNIYPGRTKNVDYGCSFLTGNNVFLNNPYLIFRDLPMDRTFYLEQINTQTYFYKPFTLWRISYPNDSSSIVNVKIDYITGYGLGDKTSHESATWQPARTLDILDNTFSIPNYRHLNVIIRKFWQTYNGRPLANIPVNSISYDGFVSGIVSGPAWINTHSQIRGVYFRGYTTSPINLYDSANIFETTVLPNFTSIIEKTNRTCTNINNIITESPSGSGQGTLSIAGMGDCSFVFNITNRQDPTQLNFLKFDVEGQALPDMKFKLERVESLGPVEIGTINPSVDGDFAFKLLTGPEGQYRLTELTQLSEYFEIPPIYIEIDTQGNILNISANGRVIQNNGDSIALFDAGNPNEDLVLLEYNNGVITIYNHVVPLREFTFAKEWTYNGQPIDLSVDGDAILDEINVDLVRVDNSSIIQNKVITDSNNWHGVFRDIPIYDRETGLKIDYIVKEILDVADSPLFDVTYLTREQQGASNNPVDMLIINDRVPLHTVAFTKIDLEHIPLSNIEFGLYRGEYDGSALAWSSEYFYDFATTGLDGQFELVLPPLGAGTYSLVERRLVESVAFGSLYVQIPSIIFDVTIENGEAVVSNLRIAEQPTLSSSAYNVGEINGNRYFYGDVAILWVTNDNDIYIYNHEDTVVDLVDRDNIYFQKVGYGPNGPYPLAGASFIMSRIVDGEVKYYSVQNYIDVYNYDIVWVSDRAQATPLVTDSSVEDKGLVSTLNIEMPIPYLITGWQVLAIPYTQHFKIEEVVVPYSYMAMAEYYTLELTTQILLDRNPAADSPNMLPGLNVAYNGFSVRPVGRYVNDIVFNQNGFLQMIWDYPVRPIIPNTQSTRHSVEKVWIYNNQPLTENLPSSIDIALYREIDSVSTQIRRAVMTPDTYGNWTYQGFNNLPEFTIDGRVISYDVKEINIPEHFTATYTHEYGEVDTTITNTRELMSLSIYHIDLDHNPVAGVNANFGLGVESSFNQNLLSDTDGRTVVVLPQNPEQTFTLSEVFKPDQFLFNVDFHFEMDSNGQLIVVNAGNPLLDIDYIPHPNPLFDGMLYYDSNTGKELFFIDNDNNVHIYHHQIELRNVSVYKQWYYGSTAITDENIPVDQVEIHLFADGNYAAKVAALSLNTANNWLDYFVDMPIYNQDGSEIIYSVREYTIVEHFTPSYDRNSNADFVVTNTREEVVIMEFRKLGARYHTRDGLGFRNDVEFTLEAVTNTGQAISLSATSNDVEYDFMGEELGWYVRPHTGGIVRFVLPFELVDVVSLSDVVLTEPTTAVGYFELPTIYLKDFDIGYQPVIDIEKSQLVSSTRTVPGDREGDSDYKINQLTTIHGLPVATVVVDDGFINIHNVYQRGTITVVKDLYYDNERVNDLMPNDAYVKADIIGFTRTEPEICEYTNECSSVTLSNANQWKQIVLINIVLSTGEELSHRVEEVGHNLNVVGNPIIDPVGVVEPGGTVTIRNDLALNQFVVYKVDENAIPIEGREFNLTKDGFIAQAISQENGRLEFTLPFNFEAGLFELSEVDQDSDEYPLPSILFNISSTMNGTVNVTQMGLDDVNLVDVLEDNYLESDNRRVVSVISNANQVQQILIHNHLIIYRINYIMDGGTNHTSNPTSYRPSQTPIILEDPTRNGFTFNGWIDENGINTSGVEFGGTGDRTFTARWTADEFRITYVMNGGTNDSANPYRYTVLSPTITLNDPSRVGYDFIGWYVNGVPKNSIIHGSIGDIEFEARWSDAIVYPISYVLNGGTNAPGNPSSYTVASPTITLQEPTRDGFVFTGWSPTNTIPTGSTGPREFEAIWEESMYTITYVLNGGTNDASNPSTYTITTPTITLNDPTRIGYEFVRWVEGNSIPFGSTGNKVFTAEWSNAIIYDITYTLNGGTNHPANPSQYTVESGLITLADPIRPGYSFLGWTPVGNIPSGSTGNRHFTATWSEIIVYNITYNLNGGINATNNPSTFTVNTPTFTIQNPTRLGYTFLGWTSDSPTTIPLGSTGDRVFTANWSSPIIYHIEYTFEGMLPGFESQVINSNPVTYTVNTATFTLNEPVLAHHTFEGWLIDGDLVDEVTVTQGSIGNLSFTGVFAPIEYWVVYAPGDHGTWLVPSEGATFSGLVYGVPTPGFALIPTGQPGWEFAGWSPAVSETITGNATYVAQWRQVGYTVAFSPGDHGTFEEQVIPGLHYGDATPNAPEVTGEEGWAFTGWSPELSETVNGSVTYTAQWTRVYLDVTFHAMGGTMDINSLEQYTLPVEHRSLVEEHNASRPGYRLVGWSHELNENRPVFVNDVELFALIPDGHRQWNFALDRVIYHVTLYAIWEADPIPQVSISYDTNGGIGGPPSASYDIGSTINLSLVLPTRDGYTFMGWLYDDVTYQPGQSFTLGDSDVIMVAQWSVTILEANHYQLNYNANGGIGAPVYEIREAGEVFNLSLIVPTREGYTFLGWLYEDVLYQPGDEFTMPEANVTLIAQWDADDDTDLGMREVDRPTDGEPPVHESGAGPSVPTTGSMQLLIATLSMFVLLIVVKLRRRVL